LPYFSSTGNIVKQNMISAGSEYYDMCLCLLDCCRWNWSSNYWYISI